MSQLSLSLFGRFRATTGDTLLKLTSPKSQALLAWLALHPGEAHSRDALLLWPEHNDSGGRLNMRKTLSRLRKQLPTHLIVNRKTVQLSNGNSWQADVVEFQSAIEANEFETAATLYSDDFLIGLEVDSAEFPSAVAVTP